MTELDLKNESPNDAKPVLAVRCVLVEIDAEILQTCIDMYKTGEKLTAIKWLIEEAKRDRYTFGIKWAQEYFEKIGLDKVDEQ
jgi:hypothetical protein